MKERAEMERRESERFPVRQLTAYGSHKAIPYRIVNVGRAGCSLESREPLGEVDSSIVLDLPLPADTESLALAARIVWEEGDPESEERHCLRYGLSFDGMDKMSEMILDAYLDFLRRDVHIAQLEEAWMKLKRVHEKIEVLIAFEEKKKAAFLH